jgi:hypothetical protein
VNRQFLSACSAIPYAGVNLRNQNSNLSILAVPDDFLDRPWILKPKKLAVEIFKRFFTHNTILTIVFTQMPDAPKNGESRWSLNDGSDIL